MPAECRVHHYWYDEIAHRVAGSPAATFLAFMERMNQFLHHSMSCCSKPGGRPKRTPDEICSCGLLDLQHEIQVWRASQAPKET